MREALGRAKTVSAQLKGVKYSIDYYRRESSLPLASLMEFDKTDLETRSLLYLHIAQRIWNPTDLLKGVQP